MVAKAIRNMQVPAYCPVVWGIQEDEKRAVLVEVKKVVAIESIVIILDESMGMVPVEDPGIGISILIIRYCDTDEK